MGGLLDQTAEATPLFNHAKSVSRACDEAWFFLAKTGDAESIRWDKACERAWHVAWRYYLDNELAEEKGSVPWILPM